MGRAIANRIRMMPITTINSTIVNPRFRPAALLLISWQPAEKVGVAPDFWVAQRFTAAITGLFLAPALAAGVRLHAEKHFFRKLLVRPARIRRAFTRHLFGTAVHTPDAGLVRIPCVLGIFRFRHPGIFAGDV